MELDWEAVCHWTHSFAWWRCRAEGGGSCPVWTAVCPGSFFLSLSPESPALCPLLSQLSSPDCTVDLCLSSCCFLPSKPQHKRGRWPPQTGKTSAVVFCICWRTPAFSGSTDGSVLSCVQRPCLLSSPTCHPASAPDICRSWPPPHRPPWWTWVRDVVSSFWSPPPYPWSWRCSAADGWTCTTTQILQPGSSTPPPIHSWYSQLLQCCPSISACGRVQSCTEMYWKLDVYTVRRTGEIMVPRGAPVLLTTVSDMQPFSLMYCGLSVR